MRFKPFTVSLAAILGLAACQPQVSVGDLATDSLDASDGQKVAGDGTLVTGGGADGSGPGSDSGSSPEACVTDLEHVIAPPAADCPLKMPEQFARCNLAENAICTWQLLSPGSPGYEIMGCYADKGVKVWWGYSVGVAEHGGIHNELCPRTPIEPDSSCDGHADELCHFWDQTCLCDAATATWSCHEPPTGKPLDAPVRVQRLCAPVDETKLVKDLTPDEIKTWCHWAADPVGGNPPFFGPTPPPYDATLYSDTWGGLHSDVCMPQLPPDLCELNVKARPSCDASVAQLDDCLESMVDRGENHFVGHGCDPFLANPRCQGIHIVRANSSVGQCSLPFK